jgi:hypothetical protein
MDGKVKATMNGRMEPISVEVKDGALGDAKVRGCFDVDVDVGGVCACCEVWVGAWV